MDANYDTCPECDNQAVRDGQCRNCGWMQPAPIDAATIGKVYSGQTGRCCCGCCGKYSNTHRSINLICRKIDKLTKEGYKRQDSDLYFSLDTETRRYIAYRR